MMCVDDSRDQEETDVRQTHGYAYSEVDFLEKPLSFLEFVPYDIQVLQLEPLLVIDEEEETVLFVGSRQNEDDHQRVLYGDEYSDHQLNSLIRKERLDEALPVIGVDDVN